MNAATSPSTLMGKPPESDAATRGIAVRNLLLSVVCSIISFCVFLWVREGVEDSQHHFLSFDHAILTWMSHHQMTGVTEVARFCAWLGSPLVMGGAALLGVITGFFDRRVRGAAWTLPLAILGGGLLIQVVKETFRRQRPDLFTPLLHETGYSFPSGHSLIALVVYGLLGYFALRHVHRKAARRAVEIGTIALVFLIGLSRVYVGVHYPTDVLAGWFLGLPWLFGCLGLHEKLARHYGGKVGEPVLTPKSAEALPQP